MAENPFARFKTGSTAQDTSRGVEIPESATELRAAELAEDAAMRAEQASQISKGAEKRAIGADERARVKELRDAFRGEDATRDYEKAFPNYVAALKTEPSEDLTLLYLYAKTIDPQSTVGASDMDNINSSDARLPGAVQSALRELRASDGKFTDAARSSIRSGLHKVITQKNQAYKFTRDRFMSDAQSDVYNVDPMLVVGKPFGTQQQVDDIKSYWRKEYERNPESIPEAFRTENVEAPAVEPTLVEFETDPNLVVGTDGKVYDKRTGQPIDINSEDPNNLGQAFYAGVGDIAQGVGELAGIVGNPANAAVNALFGTNLSTDLGQTFREATGAPQGDPLASAINRAGVTGLTGIGGASLAARTLPTLASREIAATLATQPAQQVAANIGGGAAAEVVRQQGGGIPAQLAATIVGGVPAAGAVNLGQSMMRAAPDVISSFRGAPQAVSSGTATEVADVAPTSLIAQVTDAGMGQKRYSTPEGAFVTVMENAPYAPRQNSVTGFFVPEDARGQRIGSQLLEEVLRKYPAEDISTSISSEPSARAFYNLGFRPLGNPTGSLDDALAIMREDSSVSMAIPKGGDSPLKIDPATQVSPRMFEAGETVTSRSAGAMGTSPEQIRLMQAEGLPVPVQLTRGAAARDPEQLAFEKEQIFSELGGPLRRRAEENNLQALQNFDRFIDMTGAEAPDVASTGNAVINALSQGYQASKNRVRTAYTAADKAGETAEMVPYNSIIDFINQQTPTTRTTLAPILQSTLEKLNMEDSAKTGMVSIRSLEDVRKSINKAVQPGTPNESYGTALKELIDASTEGVGGDLYKKARELRIDQANKFENRAIVARLVSNIKNMDDRRVPADRVFKTAILNESPENIQFLRRTLRDLGDDGKQAWSELQGATLRHIQQRATANVNKTSENLDVVSAAQLNRAVDELDKNGRLDLIFNPKMSQQVRDLRDVIQYVNTVPPGTSINTSGTARTLAAALGEMVVTGTATSIPLPILTGIKVIRDQVKNAKIKKQINRSLLPRDQRD
jgi:GNAT superfamily N-acetyltransferase